jgi:hypothetical protein
VQGVRKARRQCIMPKRMADMKNGNMVWVDFPFFCEYMTQRPRASEPPDANGIF